MGKIEILWNQSALDDLERIVSYIAKDSPLYAEKYALKMIESLEILKTHPCSGRIVPEMNNQEIREIIFDSYRLIYCIRGSQKIEVLSIIHGNKKLILNF
ncbi:MAG TPA: type II toxin-antitoxin system RelE/ParE family toxin [Spirochaetia bacterium]|nr:type II toxin-antitoxin system RelE/ParE family toxin [Spirochaetia bacterium]